jgi:HSP20 family protein
MTLIRWNPSPLAPTRDLARLHDEMDRLFDDFIGRPLRGDFAPTFLPPVDIDETAEDFVIRADLPGMGHKDVKVSLMGDTLTIRGQRRLEERGKNDGAHRTERVAGQFERSFTLGKPVRGDQVQATFKDGVLEIRIPKAEDARVREIEVKVG